MSEHCETCVHWDREQYTKRFKSGMKGYCNVLPGLLGLSCDTYEVSGYFGCHGHEPRTAEPKILKVYVDYVTANAERVVEDMDYEKLQPDVRDAVAAFLAAVRVKADGMERGKG